MTKHLQEYDDNGNLIYYKDPSGYEEWWEYDKKGNCIHSKDSTGYEEWWEFDENGKRISHKIEFISKKKL